jgi:hypothetical protein
MKGDASAVMTIVGALVITTTARAFPDTRNVSPCRIVSSDSRLSSPEALPDVWLVGTPRVLGSNATRQSAR